MPGSVVVDCFPENVQKYRDGYAIVAVDVIRATTTAITGVSQGRRVFPVATLEDAIALAARLQDKNPLVVGELGGNMPYGFDMTNSPALLAERTDVERPMILVSTSGTPVICESAMCKAGFAACLRNYSAQISYLASRFDRVAVIGAGSRGEFREEDQLCCSWIAEGLVRAGFEPGNDQTSEIIRRWSGVPADAFTNGKSVDYLRRSGQMRDLDFILGHLDDLSGVFAFREGELVQLLDSK
ncbi:MAG: 2-phosphosulfolactate phosphatase [Candidatus Acidiferrales bacterium]